MTKKVAYLPVLMPEFQEPSGSIATFFHKSIGGKLQHINYKEESFSCREIGGSFFFFFFFSRL